MDQVTSGVRAPGPNRRSRLIEASEILSGPRWLRAAVLTGIAFCAVLPLVATALYSLATVWRRKPLPDDFTLQWWASTLTDPVFLGALGRSVMIALLTVVAVNIIVLPPLYWSHIANRRIRPLLEACALIPFVLPGVAMAAGINRFVGLSPLTAQLQATPALLLLAIVAASFPIYLWAVDGSLRAANVVSLWEAATVHGAGPWRTLRRVAPRFRLGNGRIGAGAAHHRLGLRDPAIVAAAAIARDRCQSQRHGSVEPAQPRHAVCLLLCDRPRQSWPRRPDCADGKGIDA